jgi:hypothetical protein
MEKTQQERLKEVIHLYLGCEVFDEYNGRPGKLTGVSDKCVHVTYVNEWVLGFDEIKPILRSLDDMTEEELCKLFNQKFASPFAKEIIYHMSKSLYGLHKAISQYGDFDTIPKLLKERFDLFNLIPDGIAINAKELQK